MRPLILDLALSSVDEVYDTASVDPPLPGGVEVDPDRPRRLAAVISAYHAALAGAGSPLILGWIRPAAGGPVTVVTTGQAAGGGTGPRSAPAALSFPPGCRGTGLPARDAAALLDALPYWTRLGGVVDGLLLDDGAATGAAGVRPGLADSLLGAWHQPFGWLLLAEPLPLREVSAEAAAVAAQERDARTRSTSPDYAVRVERLQRRHRELRAGESTGLWRVHLLAGGAQPAATRAVAGLLCAGADLTGLPYSLVPTDVVADLQKALATPGPTSPFVAGSPLVAALARPPAVEIPGIRIVPRPTFHVTAETRPDTGEAQIRVGEVIDRDGMPAGPLGLSMDSLNRHTFVCGATGAGKSQTVRHLLDQATTAGLPWLVIEPAKAEYRRMATRVAGADVVVLRPGDALAPPVGFNPLAPADGFPLQTHADLTRALFTAAFQADEPFPQVLAGALTRCYERLGWDLTLGEPAHPGVRPRLPTLADLQTAADEVVHAIGYGREITDNVRGYIKVRLASLRLGTTGRFFDGGHRLDFNRLLGSNVVVEIEDVGDDRDKAFLIGATVIQLVEHLRVRDRARLAEPAAVARLRHLTVIEEAHRLLRRADQPGPAAHAVELFAALLAEVRAYGEGLIIAEQIPAKLVPDVIKNTAVKIVHRLPAADDRQTVGATMNLTDEQSRFLVTVPPGTGAVFADGMDHPILVAVPDGTNTEVSAPAALVSSPATLIGQANSSCPALCTVDACSLRRMTDAQRVLRRDRRMVVWAELAVVGHLAGMPAPAPGPTLRADLATLDPRLLDCAVRHAVDAAVTTRSAALATSHSPAQFAAHVAAELRAQLDGAAGSRCPDPPRRWLAGCFSWNPVRVALKDHCAANPHAGRHPDSERWAAEYGRFIDGATGWDQEDLVRRWCLQLLADWAAVDAVRYGGGTPSALETAVGCQHNAPGWSTALERSLADLVVVRRWPVALLPGDAGSTGGRGE
jgi:DNA helicase HerA-like ATPase